MQAQRPEVTDARNNVSLEAFIRQMQYTNVSHASLLGEASMVRLERNEGYLYLRSLEKRRFAVRESGRKAIKRRAEFNTFVFREVRALEERLREARRRVVQQEADHRSELNSLLRVLSLLWARMRDSEKEMLRTKPAHEADHILPLYKFVEWCAEDMQTWRNDPDVEVRSYQEQLRVAQRIFEEVQNERSGHEKPDFLQHHGFQRTGVRGRGAALVGKAAKAIPALDRLKEANRSPRIKKPKAPPAAQPRARRGGPPRDPRDSDFPHPNPTHTGLSTSSESYDSSVTDNREEEEEQDIHRAHSEHRTPYNPAGGRRTRR